MFIKQEAEEKANEIRVSSEEVRCRLSACAPGRTLGVASRTGPKPCGVQEFNLEKLNLLESEKQRIRKEYERKDSQVEASKKMCASLERPAPLATCCSGSFVLPPRTLMPCGVLDILSAAILPWLRRSNCKDCTQPADGSPSQPCSLLQSVFQAAE